MSTNINPTTPTRNKCMSTMTTHKTLTTLNSRHNFNQHKLNLIKIMTISDIQSILLPKEIFHSILKENLKSKITIMKRWISDRIQIKYIKIKVILNQQDHFSSKVLLISIWNPNCNKWRIVNLNPVFPIMHKVWDLSQLIQKIQRYKHLQCTAITAKTNSSRWLVSKQGIRQRSRIRCRTHYRRQKMP